MRLIDADDLAITILTNDLCGDDNVDKAIINAPTVNAIPIDWLLNKLLEYDLLETHHTICCLWEKWEEENEQG